MSYARAPPGSSRGFLPRRRSAPMLTGANATPMLTGANATPLVRRTHPDTKSETNPRPRNAQVTPGRNPDAFDRRQNREVNCKFGRNPEPRYQTRVDPKPDLGRNGECLLKYSNAEPDARSGRNPEIGRSLLSKSVVPLVDLNRNSTVKPPPPPPVGKPPVAKFDPVVEIAPVKSVPKPFPVAASGTSPEEELLALYEEAVLQVEAPYQGNGNVFQVRTTIGEEVFIGRDLDKAKAVQKCCTKAVKFIKQYWDSEQGRFLAPHERKVRVVHEDKRREKRSQANGDNDETGDRKRKERRRKNKYERLNGWQEGEDQENQIATKQQQDLNANEIEESENGVNFSIPTLIITSEDNDEEFCEYMEEKLKPNVPIKNAVMMLNELFPPPKAPQYKVTSQTGPPNNPTFTMVCTINGKSFTGEGKSKKESKLACSQKAIEVLYGYKISETKSVPERSNPRANCDLDDWMELEGKNPVSILNELYPGIQYQLISTTGPSHAPQFVIKASLNDMSFEGSGKSKKDAKLNASKALLVHLHKVGFDPMTGDMMSTQVNNNLAAEGHSLADQIGQMVTNKYQVLFGTTTYSKRRVMSGIVMTKNGIIQETGDVICVASGTKCINGEQISLEGCVINDSHAEIVARRCLVLFLYSHLELLIEHEDDNEEAKGATEVEEEQEKSDGKKTDEANNGPASNKDTNKNIFTKEDSIFQRSCDENNLFELKPGIEFHLFITTSPCGDARIFSLHESSSAVNLSNNQTDDFVSIKRDKTKKRGQDQNVELGQEQSTELGQDLIDEDEEKKECALQTESQLSPSASIASLTSIEGGLAPTPTPHLPTICSDSELVRKQQQQDSSRGMLRSKIECGMGTVPINPKVTVQTWDGVMSGDRLLTMACSDKILRWNVLGVQGAMLTHLVKPIYLSSVTVGSKFHPGHMKRALYERIESHLPSTDLPEHFRLNTPDLYATTSPETRQATKAHDYSVNWILGQGQPEIVNGSTGKTINDVTSRLSKKSLLNRFVSVSSNLSYCDFPWLDTNRIRYSEIKNLATDYQDAKAALVRALEHAGCGRWIEKPVEQDQFSIRIE